MPIPVTQRVTALVFSLLLLAVTVQLVRRRRLREEYALLWLGAGLIVLVLSVFDGLVTTLAGFFAVSYAPTLMLVFGLLFALVVLLSQSVVLSRQADRIRDLAQNVALLEWRLRQVENGPDAGVDTKTGGADGDGRVSTDRSASVQPSTDERAGRTGKVLVVGLDGATLDLIEPWAADGHLPTLERLLRHGAHGELRSTVPPMTAPAWTSFATGTNPGKHRLYDWIARTPGSYTFAPVTMQDCTAPTIYTLLSRAGRRVCTLNVPMTYPPIPVNGVMVSGMPAPSTRHRITYPSDLYGDILDAVGDYVLYPDPGPAYSESGVDAFLERLYRCTDLRSRTFDYLRGRGDWEFAMVVFNGTDTIGHALWKYMDRDHPLHDPERAAKYEHAIRDYYRYVDRYLATIVDGLDDDTTLIVMSDHGFGPLHTFIHVNNWLMAEGLLHVKRGVRAQVKRALFTLGFTPMNVYDALMQLGLGALKREVVRGQGQGLLKTLFLSFEDVDWHRTVAYSLGNVGQIYVNVAGREPLGCVQPGREYEQVRERIIARLRELRDPATGEQVVDAIYRREELYAGAQVEHAPDIVFLPRRLEYFGFGEYEFGCNRILAPVRRGISGTHRMNGIVLAYGNAIRSGCEIEDARIVDLVPTILHLMGESVPEHVDGRVLHEMLRGDVAAKQTSSEDGRAEADGVRTAGALSDADKRAITQRLRDLGYVG